MAIHVLIVDDSKVSRLMTAGLLRQLQPDAVVLEADSGQHALEVAQGRALDMAILDMNMPGMSGVDLAERLRQTLPDLRMGLLTANVQAAVVNRAAEHGLKFFRKPVTEQVMRDVLDALGARAA